MISRILMFQLLVLIVFAGNGQVQDTIIPAANPCDSTIKIEEPASYGCVFYFDTDKWALLPGSISSLDSVMNSIGKQKILRITISGHADTTGNEPHNLWLSENRAGAAANYFSARGVDRKIISISFSGSRNSVTENVTPEGRRLNRRTEIKISTEKIQNEWMNLKAGDKLVLKNIYFVGNQPVMLPTSTPELKKLLDFLKRSLCTKIEIQGHVNAAGIIDYSQVDTVEYKKRILAKNDPFYQTLSDARAKAVFDYLVKNGIASERLRHQGFGCSQMVYPLAKSEKEMQMNRRVEILVLEK